MRYIDNGDGTIIDNHTKLMWQKAGSDQLMNWNDADNYANACANVGYSDWRLPTIHELFDLIDFSRFDPAIDPIFKCHSYYYWSSSTYVDGPDSAWYVHFNYGGVDVDYKSNSYYVRCVRDDVK